MSNDHPYQVTALTFSPDGQYLASTGYDQTVKIRRVSDGQLLQTFYTEFIPSSLAFSPDGEYLLVGVPWGRVEFWRLQDGILAEIYDTETNGVNSVAFSPSGEFFAYGRHDCTVVVARNPFYTPPQRVGDMNRDGCVDDADLLMALFHFGSHNASLDMNRDGVVDDYELLAVLFNFGSGC
ncbi:MAG: hypothetical protein N2651_08245 [Fimbriimonadales bacterium]|nr:hypothetical protein [Fimbriimonadales bacterium]